MYIQQLIHCLNREPFTLVSIINIKLITYPSLRTVIHGENFFMFGTLSSYIDTKKHEYLDYTISATLTPNIVEFYLSQTGNDLIYKFAVNSLSENNKIYKMFAINVGDKLGIIYKYDLKTIRN